MRVAVGRVREQRALVLAHRLGQTLGAALEQDLLRVRVRGRVRVKGEGEG